MVIMPRKLFTPMTQPKLPDPFQTRVIDQRFTDRPKGSYTSELFDAGIDRLAQKVGEEGVEVVIAAKNDDNTALKAEVADLWFHSLALLRARAIKFSEILDTLRERHSRQLYLVFQFFFDTNLGAVAQVFLDH